MAAHAPDDRNLVASPRRRCPTNRVAGFALSAALLCSAGSIGAQRPDAVPVVPDRMLAEFVQPPASARPWTWFHVMSGNMTREGLTKDLEALRDAGVGGIVLFHVTQGIAIGPVRFGSPEHYDLIAHAAAECERLGLGFAFHNADGWSSTGGPWVTPEASMKRLVWTERLVDGGGKSPKLPQPATQEGFYRDVAVIAYPALDGEITDAALRPEITASSPSLAIATVRDGNPFTQSHLEAGSEGTPWIAFDFGKPVTVRHLRIDNTPERNVTFTLQSSSDGATWADHGTFEKTRLGKSEWALDTDIPALTAQHFRVRASEAFTLGEIALSALDRIENPEGHSILAYSFGAALPETIDAGPEAAIDPAKVVDLTGTLQPDGSLSKPLPKGKWTVMRFGYTSTGARNVNGSVEGTGLEVDKFDANAFRLHYDAFIGPVIARTRAVAPTALQGVMIDSYEVGGQNWTQGYREIYARETGRDLLPWLPAFAGRVVGSGKATRDMFAGVRLLNERLVRENYYGTFVRLMAEQGIESLIQPYGNGPLNEVDVGAVASIPSGEFWMGRDVLNTNHSVSAARLYGKPVVAAEAFTAEPPINWSFHPALGKFYGDRAWANGVNQFLFHRYAHQANTHVAPGMTMNRWGSHFDRTQPWWDTGGKAWFTYMARGQQLLRQGYAVSQVALFVGEDSPVECPEKAALSAQLPAGVQFDCLNADTLLNRSRLEDRRLILPDGNGYDLIWWNQARAPSPAAAARLDAARAAGVAVVRKDRGENPADTFAAAGLTPDLAAAGDVQPLFTHRRVGERHVYFIANPTAAPRRFDLTFGRGMGGAQLWDPLDGTVRASGIGTINGRAAGQLFLDAHGSTFVVFDPSFAEGRSHAPEVSSRAAPLTGPWRVTFDPRWFRGGPQDFATLIDWRDSPVAEVRDYSGKASYVTTFEVGREDSGKRIMLDLGKVAVTAQVAVNGQLAGTAWTAPYRIDVTRFVKPGRNRLEIVVANLWNNRLIADQALPDTSGYRPEDRVPTTPMVDWYAANRPQPAGPRRTFTTQPFFKATDARVPSGLIGPVAIVVEPK